MISFEVYDNDFTQAFNDLVKRLGVPQSQGPTVRVAIDLCSKEAVCTFLRTDDENTYLDRWHVTVKD